MNNYFREMVESDLPAVLNLELRQADNSEMRAFWGFLPKDALLILLSESKDIWVGLHDDKIECVFGVSDAIPGIGQPWFCSTEKFDEFSFSFAKQSMKVIQMMLEKYPILENYVDYRHEAAIRWMAWLGFKFKDELYIFADPDVYFWKFYMRRDG